MIRDGHQILLLLLVKLTQYWLSFEEILFNVNGTRLKVKCY